jgi:hypothetical protein
MSTATMGDKEYIKGYEIDIAKVAKAFGEDNVDAAILAMVKFLDRGSYLCIDTGYLPLDGSHPLVIVLDADSDEEKLKGRPLYDVDQTFEWMGEVLNGPSVWKKS